MLCAERRRALEGGGQRRSFGSVAERKKGPQRQQGEWDEQADKEDRQEREPVWLTGAVAVDVGDEERYEDNRDGRDCDPEPRTFVAKTAHW